MVEDGASAPYCTIEAIKDHIGEMESAKDMEFEMVIRFKNSCDKYARYVYENIVSKRMKDYRDGVTNTRVIFKKG